MPSYLKEPKLKEKIQKELTLLRIKTMLLLEPERTCIFYEFQDLTDKQALTHPTSKFPVKPIYSVIV